MGGLFSRRACTSQKEAEKRGKQHQLGALREAEERRKQQERVAGLRMNIRRLCNGQRFVVVGGDGHGKSSSINTFNHVMRLQDPDAKYQELAEVGPAHHTKTLIVRKFICQPTMFGGAVEFVDVSGMSQNDQSKVPQMVKLLVEGRLPEGTDIRPLLGSNVDLDQFLDFSVEQLRCWSIIYVASASHVIERKLAGRVGQAGKELEKSGKSVLRNRNVSNSSGLSIC